MSSSTRRQRSASILANSTYTADFLSDNLRLRLHPRNDVIIPARAGVRFCGYEVFPRGRRLKRATAQRWHRYLRLGNLGSYDGLVRTEGRSKSLREFHWHVLRHLQFHRFPPLLSP